VGLRGKYKGKKGRKKGEKRDTTTTTTKNKLQAGFFCIFLKKNEMKLRVDLEREAEPQTAPPVASF
jgi:hypothetical protein